MDAFNASSRSPEARARAEKALVYLLHELRHEPARLIVLGGLVPPLLTDDSLPSVPVHMGTADVDILLISNIDSATDLSSVEEALGRIRFRPVISWRWEGSRETAGVRIEFLCDLDEYRAEELVRPAGCVRLAALNLRGTGYVARDYEDHEIRGTLPNGKSVRVIAHLAGLQGFLLSKCVAARVRGATKDFYDLAYVLIHNTAGGPEPAAEQVVTGVHAHALPGLRSTFLEVRERYGRTNHIGPRSYATEMARMTGGEEPPLRAEAVAAVQTFIGRLLQ